MVLNWDVREDSWVSCTARRTNQPILKEISSEYPFGRTDAETEAPILWPPDVKNWLIGKGHGAGKDWRQKEKGMTEDEMVGLHHWLDGHEFGWTSGVGDGQKQMSPVQFWHWKIWAWDKVSQKWTKEKASGIRKPSLLRPEGKKTLKNMWEVKSTERTKGNFLLL